MQGNQQEQNYGSHQNWCPTINQIGPLPHLQQPIQRPVSQPILQKIKPEQQQQPAQQHIQQQQIQQQPMQQQMHQQFQWYKNGTFRSIYIFTVYVFFLLHFVFLLLYV